MVLLRLLGIWGRTVELEDTSTLCNNPQAHLLELKHSFGLRPGSSQPKPQAPNLIANRSVLNRESNTLFDPEP